MPSLLDDLPENQRHLVRAVFRGRGEAKGIWPVWQYVQSILWREGIDPEQALAGLPTWQLNYRPIWAETWPLRPDTQVSLTFVGLVNVGGTAASILSGSVMAAARIAAEELMAVEPLPTRPSAVRLKGVDLTERVNMAAGGSLSPDQLRLQLLREPCVWSGHDHAGNAWVWDVTTLRLAPFRHARTETDFLTLMEEVVGVPIQSERPIPLPLNAVAEALDHLDVVWRLRHSKPILRLARAEVAAALCTPANSAEEFAARCTALGEVLKQLDVPPHDMAPGRQGSLLRLRYHVTEAAPDRAEEVAGAIDVLRHITGVRNSVSHPEAVALQRHQIALGLHHLRGDWEASWDMVRTRTVSALRVIREALIAQM